MERKEFISYCRKRIREVLAPLVGTECILTGLPYHRNIGDILIWEGEVQFLESLDLKGIRGSSRMTFTFPALPESAVILLHGGGNFGDLWPEEHLFRTKVIQAYPRNRIVVFPQTVWYGNEASAVEDARIYAAHPDLHICARDGMSYDFLGRFFTANDILPAPDMAFCIDGLRPSRQADPARALLVRRTDKELKDCDIDTDLAVEVRDWPSYERTTVPPAGRVFEKLLFSRVVPRRLVDIYAARVMRPAMVQSGVDFLSGYGQIWSTRLHVAILSVLLGLRCTLMDNSYGKNRAFYDTWLKDSDLIDFAGL